MIKGFIPSYVFDSGIGKQIAQLKGLEKGFLYPTFAFYYVRNPAPLLLFDEIVIDEEAARRTTDCVLYEEKLARGYEGAVLDETRPTKPEAEVLEQLIDSKLFKKKRIAEMITNDDFNRIELAYRKDTGMSHGIAFEQFKAGVDIMVNRYGRWYANPDPYRFEAMNINVTQVLLEKLSAAPLDDVLRTPLYECKMLDDVCGRIKAVGTADEMVRQAREILFLPTTPLHSVDDFLELHSDPRVQSFRKKVGELSSKRATPREVARNIHDSCNELRELNIEFSSIVITFLGLAGGLTSLVWGTNLAGFGTGVLVSSSGVVGIGRMVQKIMKTEKYGWLDIVKGLCETPREPI